MISLVGDKLVRGPRFEDRQALIDEVGFHQLHQVISLQEGWSVFFGHYNEEQDVKDLGMTFMHYRLSNVFAPGFYFCFSILQNICLTEARTYIHCFAGVDRTGFICGLYRVLVMGWTPDQAWEECCNLGMHKHFQILWKHSFFERCRELRTERWIQK